MRSVEGILVGLLSVSCVRNQPLATEVPESCLPPEVVSICRKQWPLQVSRIDGGAIQNADWVNRVGFELRDRLRRHRIQTADGGNSEAGPVCARVILTRTEEVSVRELLEFWFLPGGNPSDRELILTGQLPLDCVDEVANMDGVLEINTGMYFFPLGERR